MQKVDFIRYDLTNGKILSAVSCPQYAYAFNAPPSTEVGYLSGTVTDIEAFYVSKEQFTERPSFNLPDTQIQLQANGIDSFELNNLPQGTIVTIEPDDETHEIDDGVLSFATEQPGLYTLHINAFPYRDATVIIEAIL